MKVAMTYLDGNIFQHFGRSEYFVIYTIESGNIIEKELVQISGHGHGSRATLLKELGVDALICGGMGHHAKVAMDEVQIQVYPGLSGNTDQIVDEFIKGKLIVDESAIHECKH